MSDGAGRTALVGSDEDQLIGYQRVAMEAGLVSILMDVITPPNLAGALVEGIEGSRARSDE